MHKRMFPVSALSLTGFEPHPKLTFVGAFQTGRNGLETPAELLCTADVFATVKHCVKWKTKAQWSAFKELWLANPPAEYVTGCHF